MYKHQERERDFTFELSTKKKKSQRSEEENLELLKYIMYNVQFLSKSY